VKSSIRQILYTDMRVIAIWLFHGNTNYCARRSRWQNWCRGEQWTCYYPNVQSV